MTHDEKSDTFIERICVGTHFDKLDHRDIYVIFMHTRSCKLHVMTQFFTQYNKMFKAVLVASLACSAVAFRPAPMARASLSKLSMNAEGLAGESGPLGYFDPLGRAAYSWYITPSYIS